MNTNLLRLLNAQVILKCLVSFIYLFIEHIQNFELLTQQKDDEKSYTLPNNDLKLHKV